LTYNNVKVNCNLEQSVLLFEAQKGLHVKVYEVC